MIARLMNALVERLISRALAAPYFHLHARDGALYMARYWLVKPRWWTLGCGARIHAICRPDTDRHLHDHPWAFLTVVLKGGYFEHRPLYESFPAYNETEPTLTRWHGPGSILLRRASARHRLDLARAWRERVSVLERSWQPAWTLFIFGPRVQTWGFYTATGKVAWDEYLPSDEAAYQHSEGAHHGFAS